MRARERSEERGKRWTVRGRKGEVEKSASEVKRRAARARIEDGLRAKENGGGFCFHTYA